MKCGKQITQNTTELDKPNQHLSTISQFQLTMKPNLKLWSGKNNCMQINTWKCNKKNVELIASELS
jgi:hypothetical protein